MTQDRDAFIADIGPSWSCNEALDLVLLFAAKGANGEPVKAPSPVPASVSSRSAGTSSPVGMTQPSAERANKSLRCHLLSARVRHLCHPTGVNQ
jgi:hypothetical protein